MTLRDARPDDLDALLELERACYLPNQAYSREEYRYSLTRAKAVNIVAEGRRAEGARAEDPLPLPSPRPSALRPPPSALVVGFVGAFHHATHRLGHVYTVNVHPKERGRGLGRALMEACHARLAALGMRRCALEVNVENTDAMRLYERCGYTRAELLKGYYTQYRVNDAWLYVRELP